jgi:hypothetical protein
MQIFIYCYITVHVSGVHRAHHQEYKKLYLQPLVQIVLSGERSRNHEPYYMGSLIPREYDLYQKLQIQFYVLLMMGAMDVRNM